MDFLHWGLVSGIIPLHNKGTKMTKTIGKKTLVLNISEHFVQMYRQRLFETAATGDIYTYLDVSDSLLTVKNKCRVK